MAISAVKLINPSKVTSSIPSLNANSEVLLPRSVYKRLNSLIHNKTLAADYAANKLPPAYMKILDDLDALRRGDDVDPAVIQMNEYLGSLGVLKDYPYDKDTQDIPLWFDQAGQGVTRNVALLDEFGDIINNISVGDDNVIMYTGV